MKVTHVVLSLDVGGLERGVLNQLREGVKLGQAVSVVCLERPGVLAGQVRALGIPLVSLEKTPGFRPMVMKSVRAVLTELSPDVVHTHQIGTLFYTGPVARLLRIPLVVHTEHGKENYAGRVRTRILGRLAGLFASRFYCLTADMAGHVRRHRVVPARKIRIIENGIDIEAFSARCSTGELRRSLGLPAGAPVIGTVGRLTAVKQQGILIQALAKVRTRFPECRLLIVGDGPLMGQLRLLAEQLSMASHVHFAGYQHQTSPYIQLMDVFALTSASEGMPQAALEASVAGVPVVASRVGGLPELIDHGRTGLLFEPSDEAALVRCLCELLDDSDRARTMGRSAQSRVESRFCVRRMAAEYHRQFLDLLADRLPVPG